MKRIIVIVIITTIINIIHPYKIELSDNRIPLNLNNDNQNVKNQFKFEGVNVIDKRYKTVSNDEIFSTLPRGWGTNSSNKAYHTNSEPLIIGISVILASVIVFTMIGTVIWRRKRKKSLTSKVIYKDTNHLNQFIPSYTSTINKRQNPLKFLKHRKGKKLKSKFKNYNLLSNQLNNVNDDNNNNVRFSTDNNDNNDNNDNINNVDNERNSLLQSQSQSHSPTGTPTSPTPNSPPPSITNYELPQRDTDSGALPALPPAYRPNHLLNIPSSSNHHYNLSRSINHSSRFNEKSRYVNSQGNNDFIEDHQSSITNDGSEIINNNNNNDNLSGHIAIDDKNHLQNIHLQSSSPFVDVNNQDTNNNNLNIPLPYVPSHDHLYNDNDNEFASKDKNIKSSSTSMLPLPPQTFEQSFSPFDLPYLHSSNSFNVSPFY